MEVRMEEAQVVEEPVINVVRKAILPENVGLRAIITTGKGQTATVMLSLRDLGLKMITTETNLTVKGMVALISKTSAAPWHIEIATTAPFLQVPQGLSASPHLTMCP